MGGEATQLPRLFLIRRTMEKEKEQILETAELPSIKKVVDCPRCKAKIEVEFELDMEMVMPTPDVVKKLEENYAEKKVEKLNDRG
jgi:hypothetical protein